jgi:hypothetical protein
VSEAVITGQIVAIEAGFPRTVRVPRGLVLSLFWAGCAFRVARAAFPGSRPGRRWKELRTGPEYLVTPVRLRDGQGRIFTIEIHGYLPAHALRPRDQLRVRVRRQAEDRPPRAARIVNLTTGQILRPRAPTLWWHLGPDTMLQAVLGLLMVLVLVLCLWGLLG